MRTTGLKTPPRGRQASTRGARTSKQTPLTKPKAVWKRLDVTLLGRRNRLRDDVKVVTTYIAQPRDTVWKSLDVTLLGRRNRLRDDVKLVTTYVAQPRSKID